MSDGVSVLEVSGALPSVASSRLVGDHSLIIVSQGSADRLVAAARRHGFDPVVVEEIPTATDLGRVGNVVLSPERFAELPLAELCEHDVRIWIDVDALDPWAPTVSWPSRFVKRLIDIVVAGTVLVVSAPLTAIVALAIKVDSDGPVLYTQQRLGLHGRWFAMHKFRTMLVTNDPSQHADYFARLARGEAASNDGLYKIVDDPRITRVGRILRRYSIDEIPQFLDVLRGTMSVVGPRPMLLRELSTLDGNSWRRHRAKPGITGLWQVSGRATTTFDTMIDLDVEYAATWSLEREIRILAATPAAILREETA